MVKAILFPAALVGMLVPSVLAAAGTIRVSATGVDNKAWLNIFGVDTATYLDFQEKGTGDEKFLLVDASPGSAIKIPKAEWQKGRGVFSFHEKQAGSAGLEVVREVSTCRTARVGMRIAADADQCHLEGELKDKGQGAEWRLTLRTLDELKNTADVLGDCQDVTINGVTLRCDDKPQKLNCLKAVTN